MTKYIVFLYVCVSERQTNVGVWHLFFCVCEWIKKVMKKSQEKYAKNITLNFQLKYSLCVLMITDYFIILTWRCCLHKQMLGIASFKLEVVHTVYK